MSSVAFLSMGGCSQPVKSRVGASGHSPGWALREGSQAKAGTSQLLWDLVKTDCVCLELRFSSIQVAL